MTERKTLNLRSPCEQADAAPTLNKKGRGWKISETRLDVLHDRAREMKRHSSEAHKALAKRFAMADFGRHKFTRHAVVGSAIVDFNCHTLGLAIAIDEDDTSEALATRRDKSLAAVGIRVMHIPAADILADLDAVTGAIGDAMRKRIAEKQSVRRESRPTGAPRPRGAYAPKDR
ncbi:MAG: DUF559 domain-containing protein [Alphaproteobacteria bacterium]|nr:DUF559 domain-containing protein [Alphaproteobacteria bacterium]